MFSRTEDKVMASRSLFGWIFKRRRPDGRPVPLSYKGKCFPGYYCRFSKGGRGSKQNWLKLGDTLEEAKRCLSQIHQEINKQDFLRELGVEPIEEVEFEEFAESYLEYIKRVHRPSTYKTEENKLRKFVIPRFKDRLVCDITKRDIERFVENRAMKGASIATINRDLSLLSSLFRKAENLGFCRENPVKGFKRGKEQERAFHYIDLDGQDHLIECCPPRIRNLVVLALDTGLRRGELLALEWKDANLDRKVITVGRSKNKTCREVPMTKRVLGILKPMIKERVIPLKGPDRVFHWIPEYWSGPLAKAFRESAKAAGLPDGFRLHDCRHLFACNLLRAGVPMSDVAKLLGHSSLVMTMRYANHVPANSAAQAIARFEKSKKRTRKKGKQKTARG